MTLAMKAKVGERAQLAAQQAWRTLSMNGARSGVLPKPEEIILAVLCAAAPELIAQQKRTLIGKLEGLKVVRGKTGAAITFNNAINDAIELVREVLGERR